MPVTRFLVRQPAGRSAASPSASSRATRSRSSSGSSTPTASTSPRTRQRKIERLFNREDFRRVLAAEIGDIGFPPAGPRALHRRAGGHGRPRRHPGRRLQGRRRLRATAPPSFVMPNVLAKLGADVLAVNPYASTDGRARLRPRRARRARWPTWSGPRAPTSAPSSTPTASTSRSSTTSGHVLTDDEALLALVSSCRRPPARRPDRAAGRRQPPRSSDARRRARRRGPLHQDRPPPRSWTRPAEPGVGLRRQRRRRVHPPRLPARLRRRRHPRQAARAAGPRADRACRRSSPSCPASHVAHETVVTPWEQKGTGHAHAGRADARTASVELVDGVKVLPRRRLGPGAARPRGAGHPRVGRGRRPTPRPAASPRSTPGASASSCAERAVAERPSSGTSVEGAFAIAIASAAHERARRPALLDRPRVGPGRGRHASGSASPTTPRTRSATSCSCSCPRSGRRSTPAAAVSEVESTKSVSDIYAPVAGTIVEVNADLADAPSV